MSLWLLRLILKVRGLNLSQLAELAGVTRQAVSLWFKSNRQQVDLSVATARKLSNGLAIPISLLLEEAELINPERRALIEAEYLWDQIYSDVESFAIAIARQELKALARLVQILGMFASAQIVGKEIWRKFPAFRPYLHPERARQCEIVWKMQLNLGLI